MRHIPARGSVWRRAASALNEQPDPWGMVGEMARKLLPRLPAAVNIFLGAWCGHPLHHLRHKPSCFPSRLAGELPSITAGGTHEPAEAAPPRHSLPLGADRSGALSAVARRRIQLPTGA